ncbi:hypothetical protein [Streptomyces sp. NPDC127084]|uniref:hypothetical protein n=1 Tax=Streptomyces sp. NPDC127084 TaxID=3347133 RepID=UPI003650399A
MPMWFDLVIILLFITLSYTALCAASPLGACRKCGGWGTQVRVSRLSGRLKRGRSCRRCDGYGQRFRIGRRLYNAVARLHRDAAR